MTARLDFTSEAFFRDPPKAIANLRMSGPVVATRFPLVGNVWITTTHDATAQVLKDGATFTLRKDDGDVAGLRWWMPRFVRTIANSMLTMDEPDHTRLRSIVDEAFRRRAIVAMEPRIRAIADGLADELFAEECPADLVQRYARILPLAVISELLGLPLADRPKFIAWANAMSSLTNVVSFLSLLFAFRKMRSYLEQQLQTARVQGGEGLIAELIQVEREGGQITPDEMVSMVFLLLAAGSETTTHLISGSVYELLRNPELRDWLEQDWSRVGLAVEEFLRFVSPVQFSKPRYVRRDVEVEGVRLKKGDRVMVMLAAANMDPTVHDRPETLDLERKPNRHISFGTGIHFCLGHQLARIEAACALQALFVRWPKLSLAVDSAEVRWRKRPGLRAIAKLPVAPEGRGTETTSRTGTRDDRSLTAAN
ncbi:MULTISPECIES: cytochrome P450 [Bradyrhizobium]|uniref:cytochrome P450 n=1 Tax=Bradyrhizobium TaxID=374 RepID=UPI00155E961C|nr:MULTISPECIES: cytochrome P450 [Bradyrhizobium]MDD1522164.1 cytochrome P450 [Bradyrhizobium sp. WBAH30]MDD1541408.1 cytochrome P450 [Bradyrhizobium sp. WBAH41]MDD1556968.1 cytochrome P450 [Bradyrhizobium sp. WBAH23]MDD1564769.1 cytochrome P450 [Bradyrhizobium sp. WBAH33]MDD1589678.1 cytochrome P450 [Bradyrhizobium sp. WBAH42]